MKLLTVAIGGVSPDIVSLEMAIFAIPHLDSHTQLSQIQMVKVGTLIDIYTVVCT